MTVVERWTAGQRQPGLALPGPRLLPAGVTAQEAVRADSESHLPPDVRELGEEQRQVEGELQDVVVVDVHCQRLRTHAR